MREAIEELSYVSGLRHDIRTHLNILLGAVDMVQSGKLASDKIPTYLAMIRHNSLAMLRLVNQMVATDSVENPIPPQMVSLQVDGLLATIVESVRPYAESRRLELLCDIRAPLFVLGDIEMVERIMYNLLANAIKYTEPGGFIYFSAKEEDDMVQINIADTGIGMSPEKLSALEEEAIRPVGNGMGLQLVRSLTAQLNGTLRCTSRENVGTTFYLSLPTEKRAHTVSTRIGDLLQKKHFTQTPTVP